MSPKFEDKTKLKAKDQPNKSSSYLTLLLSEKALILKHTNQVIVNPKTNKQSITSLN
ncbi:hypothetical protein Hanom_Chr02g00121101 [Helianthus anomalus]